MGQSKVNPEELRELLRAGKSQREAAEYFGVTPGRISQIKNELKEYTTRNIIQ